MPLPAAVTDTLPGVPAPLPPVDAVAVPLELVLVSELVLVTAAPLCVTKKVNGDEGPPPGAGLNTLTSNVPGEVSNTDGTTADNSDEETKVVARLVVLFVALSNHLTSAPSTKLDP